MKKIIKIYKLAHKFIYLSLFGPNRYAKYVGVNFGNNCDLLTSNWGTEPFLIELGDNVTITSGVRILTHDGSTRLVIDGSGNRYYKYSKVKIGDNVFVGINSIILPGVEIGSNVIIGAGSIVTSDISDNSVVAGSPARVISSFSKFSDKVRRNCSTMEQRTSNYKYDVLSNLYNECRYNDEE